MLYVSDLNLWLKWSTAKTYADDTTTGTSAKNLKDMIKRLEEDAANVLSFMASNGLIANAKKTSLVVLNNRTKKNDVNNYIEVKIGENMIKQENSAKLLGVTFNEKQNWNNQIQGKDGVVSALNKRFFAIKRLSNHINKKSILKLVDGLFTSKINYGLQLYGKVRLQASDPTNGDLKAIQKVQNKMARFLNSKTLRDKVPTKRLLEQVDMLSVNQLNARIKIQEIWKATNIKGYPLKIRNQSSTSDSINTRAMTNNRPVEIGGSILTKNTCVSDAIRLWNLAPNDIKNCESLYQLKKLTRIYVKTLPV